MPCVLLLSIIATPASAQWDTLHGSEERIRHCVEEDQSTKSDKALLHIRSPGRKMNFTVVDVWSLEAEQTPWKDRTEKVLAAWQNGGPLEFRDSDFQILGSIDLGGTQNNRHGDFVHMAHVQQPHFLDVRGGGADLYGLSGELAQNFEGEAMLPQADNPVVGLHGFTYPSPLGRSFPAIGDLTGDGDIELVFGNEDYEPEWQVLTAEGEQIARRKTVDAYDRAWSTRTYSMENGHGYIYFTTAHNSGLEPMMSRLYKLSLEPAHVDLGMPYEFNEVWVREFPRLPEPDEIYLYDLTRDGNQEIVMEFGIGTGEGPSVVILDREGEILYSMDQYHLGTGTIGDLDNDGTNELVWAHSEYLTDGGPAFTGPETWITGIQWTQGSFKETYRLEADDEYGAVSVATCDLTGDGRDEVIVGMGDFLRLTDTPGESIAQGKIRVLDGDGTVLWEFSLPFVRPMNIAVDDVTGNGGYDLLVGADGGFAFVLSPYSNATKEEYTHLLDSMLKIGKVDHADVDDMQALLAERHDFQLSNDDENRITSSNALFSVIAVVVLLAVTLRSRVKQQGPKKEWP